MLKTRDRLNIPWAIVLQGSPEHITERMKQTGLSDDPVFFSGSKSCADLYEAAAKELGVSFPECVVIEDQDDLANEVCGKGASAILLLQDKTAEEAVSERESATMAGLELYPVHSLEQISISQSQGITSVDVSYVASRGLS